ncbi:MAG: MFS transporter [Bosea sp. (in: a-proteobacteria)]|uniref:MFS transporter n=1 Tax=Bosea sp. (in: a-proteobacteria) TaxID=1871050 RepID=UPI002734D2DA|nr:MFS transporter [Bosea sp. (in: a-proteobacteria)]MDP3255091.1 MFS transporter [Bosea sp. (in: a-proteobacteria)]MDP3320163.1 MFS transporter [Bosea sp. (in: a-proteobacteria)]
MTTQKAPTGSFAALGAIVSGALLLQLAGTIVNTVVPLRMAVAGQPPLLIGLVASAYSVGFLAGCFAMPSLVRRIGHIRAFAVFAALQAAATLSFALIPEPWWGGPRLLMGLAAAGHGICIESWISGQASGAKRGRIFGVYQLLNRVAMIGSQIGVGYVAVQSQDVFLLASMVFSFALIPVALTRARGPESSDVVSVGLRALWRQAPAAVVGCLYVGLVSGPLTSVIPAYGILAGLDQRNTILLTAGIQVGALLMQWPMSLLADRVASRLIMLCAVSLVTATAAALLVIQATEVAQARLWLFSLFALIGGCSIPLYTVAVTHAYLRIGREQAVGLSAQLLFLWGTGAAIGPVIATGLMQAMGARGMLVYLMALSALVAIYIALRITRKPSPVFVDGERASGGPAIPEIELTKR